MDPDQIELNNLNKVLNIKLAKKLIRDDKKTLRILLNHMQKLP